MPGIFVPHPATSALTPVRAVYVADDDGLWRVPAGVRVPDTSDGNELKNVWPIPPEEPTAVATTPGPDWRAMRLSWSSLRATSYAAYIGAVQVSGSDDTEVTVLATEYADPGEQMPFRVWGYNSAGDAFKDFVARVPSVPAPASVAVASVTYATAVLSWTALAGVQDYQVVDSSGSVLATTTGTSTTLNLVPASTTRVSVRARFRSPRTSLLITGSASNPVTVTLPAAPGTEAGVYTIKPTSNGTWRRSTASWRTAGDLLRHGDAGDSAGAQLAHFFYGSRISDQFPLGSGSFTVTRFQIYMKRYSTGGATAQALARWRLHKTAGRSGNPESGWSSAQANGYFALNEGMWVDLDPTWGQLLVNTAVQSDGWRGVAWGGNVTDFMQADDDLALTTPNGTLRFTLA